MRLHRVKRSQLLHAVASLPPCVIGMEAGGSAHHWGRAFEQLCETLHALLAIGRLTSAEQELIEFSSNELLLKVRRAVTLAILPSV